MMTERKRILLCILKYVVVFKAGGLIYGALELVFRGHTHWSMVVAGGICAIFLYIIAVKSREPIWKKWIMGGAVITTVEFITGIVVNIMLGWQVWSYAHSWANLFGQICLLFALLWVLLSIPGIWLMQAISRRVFKDNQGGLQT